MSKVTNINSIAPYTEEQMERLKANLMKAQQEQAALRYIALKESERREFRGDMAIGFVLTLVAIVFCAIVWNI
jgi:hypothetical protein